MLAGGVNRRGMVAWGLVAREIMAAWGMVQRELLRVGWSKVNGSYFLLRR